MPHTSRKRGPPSQPRRRRLLDVGDGWTIVSSPSVAKSPTPSSVSTPPSNFETATIHPGVTVEKLNDEYVRYKKTWEDSGCCTEVVEVLKKTLSGRPGRVGGCVCLGLGSLTEGRSRRVGMLQLAVLETVVRVLTDLGTTSTNTIPIFAQDPVFNTLDASFLSSHFVTVLPTPAALSHLTPATLLFAPHCERSFLLPILEGSGPELAICNDIEASVIGAMSGVVGESEKEIAGEFLSRRTAWSIPVWKDMEDVVNDLCFYFRLEGEKNGALNPNPDPSAASAAVQAFLSSRAPSQSLSSSAAATALRTLTTSPKPVSEVQTKRTLRRQASTSSNGSAGGGLRGPRRRGSSGSMTERTFRDASPIRGAGRGRGRSAPPVPAIPDALADPVTSRRTTSLEPPIRVGSPSSRRVAGEGVSVNRAEGQTPRAARVGNLAPVAELGVDRTDTPGPVNFSYPIGGSNSPRLGPVDGTELDPGRRLGSLIASDPSLLGGPSSGEAAYVRREATDRPVRKKKKAVVKEIVQGGHLADGTAGPRPRGTAASGYREGDIHDYQPPTARQAGPSPQDTPNTSAATAVPRKKKESLPPADELREPRNLGVEYTSSIVSYPSDLDSMPEAGDSKRHGQRTAGQLAKQPSVVREDQRREERKGRGGGGGLESSQWRPVDPHDVQEPSNSGWDAPSAERKRNPQPYSEFPPFIPTSPAPTTVTAPNRRLELGPAAGGHSHAHENRFPPLSLPRTAHFSTTLPVTSSTGQMKHEPPPRSVSPAKSAMKPSPSSRTGSPMGSLLGRGHGQRPSEGSDDNSLRSEDGETGYIRGTSKGKKKARVSFDEESVVVGRAATPPTSPDSPGEQKGFFGQGRGRAVGADDGIKPVPALPSFDSVRPRRKHAGEEGSAEKVTESVPTTTSAAGPGGRIGASSDIALRAVTAQGISSGGASVPPSSEWTEPGFGQPALAPADPLPPLVTSVEGTGWVSDSEASYRDDDDNESYVMVESRSGDSLKRATNGTPSIGHAENGASYEKTNGTNGNIPQLVLVKPTPTLEETVDRQEWLNIPGSFPTGCGTETPEEQDVNMVTEHHATDLTPALLGISEPEPGETVAHHRMGSPMLGELAAGLNSQAQTTPGDESDSSGESVYSDAAEDLSDLEGDGFGSIDAVVESPVVDIVAVLPVISSIQGPPSIGPKAAAPYYQPSRLRQEYDSESSSGEDADGSRLYQQGVNAQETRQIERAMVHAPPETATPAVLKGSIEKPQPRRETSGVERWTESGHGYSPDLPAMNRKPRSSDMGPVGGMRKSMRGHDAYSNPSARSQPANSPPNTAFRHPEPPHPKGLLQKRHVRASDHHRSMSEGTAPPPLSVSPKKTGKMATLRRTLSHESDSDSGSSFKRRPRAAGSGQGIAMRKTMRSPPPGSEASSAVGSGARPLSPPAGSERKPFNHSLVNGSKPGQVAMRTTMRDAPTRTLSTRSSSPERTRSPLRLPGFGRSSKQKAATQPARTGLASRLSGSSVSRNAKPFKSRFADSSDDDAPIPLTPVRGIPRRSGAESRESTELSDSSDFSDDDGDDGDAVRRSTSPTKLKKPQGNGLHHSGSGRDLTTSISAHSEASKPTKPPTNSKKRFTFSPLGRHKKDPASKVRKSDIESAARRDTPLERSKLELQASKTALPINETSPTARKMKAFKAFAADSWPLWGHHLHKSEAAAAATTDDDGGDEERTTDGEANDHVGGEGAPRDEAHTTHTEDDEEAPPEAGRAEESEAESVVHKGATGRKRFRALRRVFGLDA